MDTKLNGVISPDPTVKAEVNTAQSQEAKRNLTAIVSPDPKVKFEVFMDGNLICERRKPE